jgi:hypothetical protein
LNGHIGGGQPEEQEVKSVPRGLHGTDARQKHMACERRFEGHVLAGFSESGQAVQRDAARLDVRDALFLAITPHLRIGRRDYEEVRHAGDIFSFLSVFYGSRNNGVAASIKNMFNEAVTWHC